MMYSSTSPQRGSSALNTVLSPQLHRILLRRLRKIRLRQVLIPRHDKRLHLWQSLQRILIKPQMILHNLLRRETQPLRHTNIIIRPRLQDPLIHQIRIARILQIMGRHNRHVACIASLEVESPRSFRGDVGGETILVGDEVGPFVGGGVPVQFTHGSGLDRKQRSREIFRDRECIRIQ